MTTSKELAQYRDDGYCLISDDTWHRSETNLTGETQVHYAIAYQRA